MVASKAGVALEGKKAAVEHRTPPPGPPCPHGGAAGEERTPHHAAMLGGAWGLVGEGDGMWRVCDCVCSCVGVWVCVWVCTQASTHARKRTSTCTPPPLTWSLDDAVQGAARWLAANGHLRPFCGCGRNNLIYNYYYYSLVQRSPSHARTPTPAHSSARKAVH